jgi:hypothetical protein
MADTPPSNRDVIQKWIEHLKHDAADWILAALLAVVTGFIGEILQWTSHEGVAFRQQHGWLALFGLWVIFYWAVVLVRRLWAGRL